MKKAFNWICLAMVVLAAWAGALEVSDLRLPLTRTEADRTLSKDYVFEVLQDGSVRRTWSLGDKTVEIDFDVAGDQAICIVLTYGKPVARKVAMEDCRTLAGGKAEGRKWMKTKKNVMERLGFGHARVLELEDSSYLFCEEEAKGGKCTRISLYSKAPKKNRRDLAAVVGDGRTAMGNQSGATNIKFLIEDEMRRQGPAVASTRRSKAEAASSQTPSKANGTQTDDQLASHPAVAKNRTRAVVSVSKSGADGADAVDASSEESEAKQADNLLEALGLDHPSPVQYCIGGIILLVLVIVVCCAVSSSRRRARARASFNAVSASRPAARGPVRKKTPLPAVKKD